MNVRAFEFTTSLASGTSIAMAKEALLKVDTFRRFLELILKSVQQLKTSVLKH
jgi:hypothetical protein